LFNSKKLTPQATRIATAINKALGFTPNQKNPNSLYTPMNLYFLTAGHPPSYPGMLNYNCTATEDCGRQVHFTGHYLLTPPGVGSSLPGDKKNYPTDLAFCKSPDMATLFNTAKGLIHKGNSSDSTESLYQLPGTDSTNTTITTATNNINTLTDQYNSAIATINSSLEELSNQHTTTPAQEAILHRVQSWVNTLNPDTIDVSQVIELSHQLAATSEGRL
jgi:hypothetical protein